MMLELFSTITSLRRTALRLCAESDALTANCTFARTSDGEGEWSIRTGEGNNYITPSSANIIKDSNNRVEMFAEIDENGFGMTIMAMCIVFSALLMLCLSFYAIGAIGKRMSRSNKIKSSGADHKDKEVRAATGHDSGEEHYAGQGSLDAFCAGIAGCFGDYFLSGGCAGCGSGARCAYHFGGCCLFHFHLVRHALKAPFFSLLNKADYVIRRFSA